MCFCTFFQFYSTVCWAKIRKKCNCAGHRIRFASTFWEKMWTVKCNIVTYVLALTRVFGHFGFVCAHKEFSLKQLNSNDTEHEDKQEGDQKDVTNGLDSNDDTLDHVFEAFGSINGT